MTDDAHKTTGWQPIETAPQDGTRIIILTSQWGAVEGYWDATAPDFYKSRPDWPSYDPNAPLGAWVSDWRTAGDDERRLYCGAMAKWWMPKPEEPARDE